MSTAAIAAAAAAAPAAPRFHALAIADIRRETSEAVSIAFAVPEDLRGDFAFTSGQYLTLRTRIEGEEVRRSYSICSGLDDGELRVAVKRLDGGLFSRFANETLKVGDRIEVMPPMGRFGLAPDPGAVRHYLGVAVGSGITPVISIVRTVLAREPRSRFTLLYGNRSSGTILFKEAIEDLKDRFVERLAVHHVLSREAQDVALLNGRLGAEKVATLLRTAGTVEGIDRAFLCGPVAMIEEVGAALKALGLPEDRIRTEVFTTTADTAARAARPTQGGGADAAPGARLSLKIDGATHLVAMRPDETVLDAALRHGLDLPYSCRAGMCCTCRAQVTEGAGAMAQNFSLEPWEVRAGFVLTCQYRPATPTLAVDFDAV